MKEILLKEVVYKDYNRNNASVIKNMVYKTDENHNSYFDLYVPSDKKTDSKLPAVILIHGEAKSVSSMKDIGQYHSWGKIIAGSGLNAITFNHRVLSDGNSLEQVMSDIDDLFHYVINHADNLMIDINSIAIWCFSGGAPFGLYTGMNYNKYVKCIISYYGFSDFIYINPLFETPISKELSEKYSAIRFIKENPDSVPPLFLARAGIDDRLLNDSIDTLITEALNHNIMINIVNHPTGQHAFDIFDDNNRTQEIIRQTLDYLKIHLLKN